MLKITGEKYALQRSIIVVLGGAVIGIAAFLFPLVLPEFIVVGDPSGGGVFAELPSGTTLRQDIELPEGSANTVFVALEDASDASRIRGHLISDDDSSPIDIGLGQSTRVQVADRQAVSGAWWSLPILTDETSYTLELSLADTAAAPVRLVADERSATSRDAVELLHREEQSQRLPLTLSTMHLQRQLHWNGLVSKDWEAIWQAMRWMLVSVALVIATILAVSVLTTASNKARNIFFATLIGCAVIAGIAGRIWFASQLPLINDEQFYVHDAVLLDPSATHFWKSPLLITSLRIWISAVGITSLVTLRSLLIVINVVSLSLLAYAAYRLAGKVAGISTLIVGLLLPTVIPYTSLIMTEQIMLLPAIGAATLAISLRDKKKILWWQLLLISALIGLTTAARWSGIFWLLAIALLLRVRAPQEYVRRVGWLVGPYVAAGVGFIATFPSILQSWRITEMFVEFFERSNAQGWVTKFSAWRAPFAGIAPLLIMGAVGYSGKTRARRIVYAAIVLVLIMTILPVLESSIRLPQYPLYQQLAMILPLILLCVGFTFRGTYSKRALLDTAIFAIPPLVSYVIFHKVNEKYLAEFMPAFVLMAGLGVGAIIQHIRHRKPAGGIALLVLLVWLIPWIDQPIRHPYAGTLSVEAVNEAVKYLKSSSAPNEQVLTGANLIPLLAERSPANTISHPAWIAPTFRGQPDERFDQVFDPVADQLEQQQIPWVIDEKLTTDTYRRHPRIDAALREKYVVVQTIENEQGGPITILRPAL